MGQYYTNSLNKRLSDYWTSIANSYDKKVGHGLTSDTQHLAWSVVLGSFLPSKPSTILDVGCGTGFLSQLCLEAGHRIVSLDYSAGMLSEAQRHLNNPCLCLADTQRLPFSDGQFDLVICRFLLWTLCNPGDVFVEWYRVLRPGSQILAIETAWWDTSLAQVVQNWLALLLTTWHDWRFPEQKLPVMENVYNEDVIRYLPFKRQTSRHYIEKVLDESGFEKISFHRLRTIERIEKENLPLRRQMEYHSRYVIHAYCKE